MTLLEELNQEAYDNGILSYYLPLSINDSIIVSDEETTAVVLDARKCPNDMRETALFAHELGHAATNSLYDPATPLFTVGKCEHRAWKWAVERVVDKDELDAALRLCEGNIYMAAEEISVDIELVKKACYFYFGVEAV